MVTSVQDRTAEFRAIIKDIQKTQMKSRPIGSQRQPFLSDAERRERDGPSKPQSARSEFARKALDIGRGISDTMGKLERLAQLAKRKTLFDDRPVEINELTFVIKQDLAHLNQQIAGLQSLNLQKHPKAHAKATRSKQDQEGEHNDNVVVMLQEKLANVGENFKEVLETRTQNVAASKSRTDHFVSSVSARSQSAFMPSRSESPLYNPSSNGRGGKFNSASGSASATDLLTIEPTSSSALTGSQMASDQQLLMMEEANATTSYINQRGEAIEGIERTINELGGIFAQLSTMVMEQGEMIQRIDANTEDIVENVEGAQRELMKYWSRVSGNRWLVAKMFGVLMIFFLLWVLISG